MDAVVAERVGGADAGGGGGAEALGADRGGDPGPGGGGGGAAGDERPKALRAACSAMLGSREEMPLGCGGGGRRDDEGGAGGVEGGFGAEDEGGSRTRTGSVVMQGKTVSWTRAGSAARPAVTRPKSTSVVPLSCASMCAQAAVKAVAAVMLLWRRAGGKRIRRSMRIWRMCAGGGSTGGRGTCVMLASRRREFQCV